MYHEFLSEICHFGINKLKEEKKEEVVTTM